MKKSLMAALAVLLLAALSACGGKNAAKENGIADSLELLKTVWESWPEDQAFSAAGGDSEEMVMDGPGSFSTENADALDAALAFPASEAEKIDDAASLVHMMNANTFTCGAFHVTDAGKTGDLAGALQDNIMQRQWMCGFPEKLVIMTVGDYVLSFFGTGDIVDTFKDKVSAAYEGAEVVCDEPIA